MDLFQEPSASGPLPNLPVTELEPESERDNIYYFDTIIFKVCNYFWPLVSIGFHLNHRSQG